MSNDDVPRRDDVPRGFREFAEQLDPKIKPLLIITLCPTFTNRKLRRVLIGILQTLKRKYQLFFFVLRNDYHGTRKITDDEINTLERFGDVKVYSNTAEAEKRARSLERFIAQNT